MSTEPKNPHPSRFTWWHRRQLSSRQWSRTKAVLTALLAAFLVIIAAQFDIDAAVSTRLGQPTLFRARQFLGLAPRLDSRLKILAYDEESRVELGLPESLGASRWAEIFNLLAARQPKVILFDAIFASKIPSLAEQKLLVGTLTQLRVPIYTGAVVGSKSDTPLRDRLSLECLPEVEGQAAFKQRYAPEFVSTEAFGPSSAISQSGARFGNISTPDPDWVTPLAGTSTGAVLPHLGIRTASNIAYRGNDLTIDGARVSLTVAAKTLVNWPTANSLTTASYSLGAIVKALRRGEAGEIQPGDTVIILPLMYLGNRDMKNTALGSLPGGYIHAAVANSVLTGSWLSFHTPGYPGALLTGLIIFMLASLHRGRSVQFLLLINFLTVAAAFAAFVVKGAVISWPLPLLVFNAVGLGVILYQAARAEMRSIRLEENLRGVISPASLARLKKSSTEVAVVADEQIITIMFVDIVGFSVAAEEMAPRVVFERLRTDLAALTELVHHHGGIVDKTLGDGILGFFGFNPITRESQPDHADAGLACATAIQQLIARQYVDFRVGDKQVFPLRIGLNTGPAFIGDMGHEGKIEITVIGHAVNMAKRFEDACEPFKVLIGANTGNSLRRGDFRARLQPRLTSVKHQSTLVVAFDYEPLSSDIALYEAAMHAYRQQMNLIRKAERRLVASDLRWQLRQGEKALGFVLDYSPSGLCVELGELYARKVLLAFDIEVIRQDRSGSHMVTSLTGLYAQVRWGRAASGKFLHGLELSQDTAQRVDLAAFGMGLERPGLRVVQRAIA